MTTTNTKVKKKASEHQFAMSFEDIEGGDTLHTDKEVSDAALERGRVALKLFSLGGILV